MRDAQAKTTYLKDYSPPAFEVKSLDLTFQLYEEGALVTSCLQIKRTEGANVQSLYLNGEDLELRSVKVDGALLDGSAFDVDDTSLTIGSVPVEFVLEIETWIKPQENKRLEGLYKSSAMFCTQCEAEGFRRITYYLDRPDVMTVFTTRIEADRAKYPKLLSNGNPIDSGELGEGRHFVTWHDPFPKPCYLFALVAGDLFCQQATFETCSGKCVDLSIFVDHKNADKCDYALDCLKRSMKWDEEVYGREYDLDIFMIVAVDDFNMGAMENKGLNIFNSSCVLAKPDAATDNTYQRIDAIVAHEYFHNWSGNRVTCRDWFQLSLKEGFTVFRDSAYSADMNSKVVKRIEDVNILRTAQFAEDAGPMSHPIRPASYMEISNFYTLTVYEKGAEVVRMLHTLLGEKIFRKGSDLYFERHDGEAVTTEDFVAAMESVSGRDFTQFKRWYDQGGTPEVAVTSNYSKAERRYTLSFKQTCPPTPGQESKKPFLIPISLGLVGPLGEDYTLSDTGKLNGQIFELTKEEDQLVFENIDNEPIPSLLRGFSAPVKLTFDYSDEQLLFLMKNDNDGFNRWDAGQRLSVRILQGLISDCQKGRDLSLSESYVDAFRDVLTDKSLDKAMVCNLMMLPAESYLIQLSEQADVESIHRAREFVRLELSKSLESELQSVYLSNMESDDEIDLSYKGMSQRAIKNMSLSLLSVNSGSFFLAKAQEQFKTASNMTDSLAALSCLLNSTERAVAESALSDFHSKWKLDAQVMETWFSVQSGNAKFSDLSSVKKLMELPDFDISNPNKVRSVIGVFCNQNLPQFHEKSGSGYSFLADNIIELDNLNPQIASRLLTPLTRWRKFDDHRQSLMIDQLSRIFDKENLSKDVREVLEKTLPKSE